MLTPLEASWGATLALLPMLLAVHAASGDSHLQYEHAALCVWLMVHQLAASILCTTDWHSRLPNAFGEAFAVCVVVFVGGSPHLVGVILCSSVLSAAVVSFQLDGRDRAL